MNLLKILTSDHYSFKCKLIIIKHYFNSEFHGILRIIEENPHLVLRDDLLFKRLCLNPDSFYFSFWKNHPDLSTLDRYSELEGSILDFGCGTGHLDILLSRKGRTIHGIDISPLAIRIANYLRESESSIIKKRVSFSAVNVTRDESKIKYDVIWSNHVFEHINDPSTIFSGLKNWGKEKAFILITVPLGLAYDDPGHIHHFFTQEQLKSHFNKFIDIDKIEINADSNEIRLLGRLV